MWNNFCLYLSSQNVGLGFHKLQARNDDEKKNKKPASALKDENMTMWSSLKSINCMHV